MNRRSTLQQSLIAEAGDHQLSPARATHLAEVAPIEVAEVLGKNPALPSQAVALLAARPEVTLRRLAALHPNAPAATLRALALDPSEVVQSTVAGLLQTDIQTLEQIAHHSRGASVDLVLAQRDNTPSSLQLALASRSARVRLAQARQPSADEALLLHLLTYPEPSLHALIAQRAGLPEQVQVQLAQARNAELLLALATNPDTSTATLTALAVTPHQEVREAVWAHPRAPLPLLVSTALDPATLPTQREEIHGHPAVPEDLRQALDSLAAASTATDTAVALENQHLEFTLAVSIEEERQRLVEEAQQTLLSYRLDLETRHQSRLAELHAGYARRLQREHALLQQQSHQKVEQDKKRLERELTRRHAEEHAQVLAQAATHHELERQRMMAELRAQERHALVIQRQELEAAAQQRLEQALQHTEQGALDTGELDSLRTTLIHERQQELSRLQDHLEQEFQRAVEQAKSNQTTAFETARLALLERHAREAEDRREALLEEHLALRDAATQATRDLAQQRGEQALRELRDELQAVLDIELQEYIEALEQETQDDLERVRAEAQQALATQEEQLLKTLEREQAERKQAVTSTFSLSPVMPAAENSIPIMSVEDGPPPSLDLFHDLLGRPPRRVMPPPPPQIEEALRALWRARYLSMPDLDDVLARTGALRAARRALSTYAEELVRLNVPLLVQDFSTSPPAWQIDSEVFNTL